MRGPVVIALFALVIGGELVGCKTTMPVPKAAKPEKETPAPTATYKPAGPTAPAAPASTPASTEVGEMSDDGAKNIVIANYLAKAITSPSPANWDANKIFAGLADGSVRSYIAGSYLGGPGWSAAPQEDKYYAKDGKSLVGGNLITPIPTDSDIDGGNIAFASKDGGTTWKQVGWNNSTGPSNYSAYYGPGDKFKWSGFKLVKR